MLCETVHCDSLASSSNCYSVMQFVEDETNCKLCSFQLLWHELAMWIFRKILAHPVEWGPPLSRSLVWVPVPLPPPMVYKCHLPASLSCTNSRTKISNFVMRCWRKNRLTCFSLKQIKTNEWKQNAYLLIICLREFDPISANKRKCKHLFFIMRDIYDYVINLSFRL